MGRLVIKELTKNETYPITWLGCVSWASFSGSGLNSVFYFGTVCHTKVRGHNLSYD